MTITVTAGVKGTLPKTVDVGTVDAVYRQIFSLPLAYGTANGECDLVYSDTFTIAASGSTTLDLAGSLTMANGAAAVFVEVAAIFLTADAANTNNIIMGNNASADFIGWFGSATHTLSVTPGGAIFLAAPGAGRAVTATSADIIKLANSSSGTSVTGTIVIVGRSA